MLNLRGIKARPHDLEAMLRHHPALVELHCSVDDLAWQPAQHFQVPLAVHLPEYHAGRLINPASLNEAERQDAERLYAYATGRAVAWADFFNVARPKVVFHPGGMGVEPFSPGERAAARIQLDKTIRAMVGAAQGQANILVENLPAHCWFFGGDWLANLCTTAQETAEVAAQNGIGMTLDLCHLHLAAMAQGFSLAEAVQAARPQVRHVHYSGANGVDGEGLQVGEGDFDLGAALHQLQDLDVVAVPEIWFGHEQEGAGFVKAWGLAEQVMALEQAGV